MFLCRDTEKVNVQDQNIHFHKRRREDDEKKCKVCWLALVSPVLQKGGSWIHSQRNSEASLGKRFLQLARLDPAGSGARLKEGGGMCRCLRKRRRLECSPPAPHCKRGEQTGL